MKDLFSSLIHDALSYARSQPPSECFFASPQEMQLFQHIKVKEDPPLLPSPSPLKISSKPISHPPLPKKPTPEPVPEIKPEGEPSPLKPIIPSHKKPSEEIVKILRKISPALALSDHTPDDFKAKKIRSAWKEKLTGIDVVLLALNESPDTIELMKNLAKAIQKDLGQVKLMTGDRLEQEKRWDLFFQTNSFRLAIASLGMQAYPELLKLYRAVPSQQTVFIAHTPLIVLEPGSVYKDSLEKKAALWKTICQTLKN